jgi:hypothetical protein
MPTSVVHIPIGTPLVSIKGKTHLCWRDDRLSKYGDKTLTLFADGQAVEVTARVNASLGRNAHQTRMMPPPPRR